MGPETKQDSHGDRSIKLDGSNWNRWRAYTRDHLVSKDVWDIVTGDEPMPKKKYKTDRTDNGKRVESDKSKERRRAWTKREAKALRIIKLALDEDVAEHILSETSAYEAWDKLEQRYNQKDNENRGNLVERTYAVSHKTGTKVGQTITTLNSMWRQLTDLGKHFDDEDKAARLIGCMRKVPAWTDFASRQNAENSRDIREGVKNPYDLLCTRFIAEQASRDESGIYPTAPMGARATKNESEIDTAVNRAVTALVASMGMKPSIGQKRPRSTQGKPPHVTTFRTNNENATRRPLPPWRRAPLSTDVLKERIENDTCIICGATDHWKRDCPQAPQPQANTMNTGTSTCPKPPPPVKSANVRHLPSPQVREDNRLREPKAMVTTDLSMTNTPAVKPIAFITDSGCSQSIVNEQRLLKGVRQPEQPVSVSVAQDGTTMRAAGVGTLTIPTKQGGEVHINEVLYVPSAKWNLLSVPQMTTIGPAGSNITFTPNQTGCEIRDALTNKVTATASLDKNLGLYTIDTATTTNAMAATATTVALQRQLWHQRVGHTSDKAMEAMLTGNHIQEGNAYSNVLNAPAEFCETCQYAKSTRQPFTANMVGTRSARPGQRTHMDIAIINVPSIGGAKYFAIFVDDYTRYTTVVPLASKGDIAYNFGKYHKRSAAKHGSMEAIRCDNAKEQVEGDLRKYMDAQGIEYETSMPYTPEQDGLAERHIRTIMEYTRSMLIHSKINWALWPYAAKHAAHIKNVTPRPTNPQGKSAFELWHGTKPSISHLKTFGCVAYVHVPKEKRKCAGGKLVARSWKGIYVGNAEEHSGYAIWNPHDTETPITYSRDVVFDEQFATDQGEGRLGGPVGYNGNPTEQALTRAQLYQAITNLSPHLNSDPEEQTKVITIDTTASPAKGSESGVKSGMTQEEFDTTEVADDAVDNTNTNLMPATTMSTVTQLPPPSQPSNRFEPHRTRSKSAAISAATATQLEPRTVDDIQRMHEPNKTLWMAAMQAEYESLIKNQTWELCDTPAGRKPIKCGWTFKAKKDANGNVERYKARLVAKGYSQREGIDYQETFAPVVKPATFRTLLSIAATLDMDLNQLDVSSAFLNAELKEEIYMSQPEGFVIKDKEGLSLRLLKSLYGLKQASREWNKLIHKVLINMGYKQNAYDHCLYTRSDKSGLVGMIGLWVDDSTVATRKGSNEMTRILAELRKHFEVTSEGDLKWFLGIKVERNRAARTITLSQEAMVKSVLERFHMTESNPVRTPLDSNTRLSRTMSPTTDKEKEEMKQVPYREAVGALLYIAQSTRPDISTAVGALSRYLSEPGQAHWTAAKRVMRYLKGTADMGLTLGSKGINITLQDNGRHLLRQPIVVYCDSDYAGDVDTRRSTLGFVVFVAGGASGWKSSLQHSVALSTAEAETMALCKGGQEGEWLRLLVNDMGIDIEGATVIMEDNRAAIDLTKDPKHQSRAKHIDVKYFYVRDLVTNGRAEVRHCATEDMYADILTKALPADAFEKLRTAIGVGR